MKIAVIFASLTPQLLTLVERELRAALPEEKSLHIAVQADPSLAAERDDATIARKLVKMYVDAVQAGADVIYHVPSASGAVASGAKETFAMMDVALIRMDDWMAEAAVEMGPRVGLIATQEAALNATRQLVEAYVAQKGKAVNIQNILVADAYGRPKSEVVRILSEKSLAVKDSIDTFILAQESLALCEKELRDLIQKPVLSSPRYGALQIKQVLRARD